MKKQENRMIESAESPPLLEVKHLAVRFPQYAVDTQNPFVLQVIHDIEICVHAGEVVAVVGASGSGKTLLADAILGLLPQSGQQDGAIYFKGEKLTEKKQKALRGKEIALIPQSVKALDPLMKTGKQVQMAIREKKNKRVLQENIFQRLGLPLEVGRQYPFELSGGMARRVLMATAMVSGAQLLIADEPTPGLDETVRDESLQLLKELTTAGKGLLLISHDIQAALQIADKVAVFKAGKTVEVADSGAFKGAGENLKHPYTRALWCALPEHDFINPVEKKRVKKEKIEIAHTVLNQETGR